MTAGIAGEHTADGPGVTVVVISHNEGTRLRDTVDSLLATAPGDVDVVVVDDHSSDGSLAALDGLPRVRTVRPPRRLGVAGARNYGARHAADSRVLVFSDAHVTARPGWLEPLLVPLAGGAGAAAPAISPLGATGSWGYGCTWRDASLTTAWLRRRPQGNQEVPMVCGCFLAVDRAAFDAVGGFDDGLATWGLEDAELSLALWRSERPCVVVPEAEVEHLFRPRFHYRVAWETTLHNILRLAVVHFPEVALTRVLSVYRNNPALPSAYARVLDSDVWLRRSAVADCSARDGAWFLDRFEIGALQ